MHKLLSFMSLFLIAQLSFAGHHESSHANKVLLGMRSRRMEQG